MPLKTPFYGLLAEFDSPTELVRAAHAAREQGYRRMDAYAPFPVEGLYEALGHRPTRLPYVIFAGGLLGALGGYGLQAWVNLVAYPLNIGGRPLHSWPAFIPVTFETTVLTAALFTVLGMLAMNGLPRPYHPLFHVPRFALASRDQFFLCIEAGDPEFDYETTRNFLAGFTPLPVVEVPH
jgi:hypothetical protein